MGTMSDLTPTTFLYSLLSHLLDYKTALLSTPVPYNCEIYISCFEITADECEEVNDLIKSSMSQTSSDFVNNSSQSLSESDMQEICLDSDNFEELKMVTEDIVNKRQTAEIGGHIFTTSNLGKLK